MRVDVPRQQLSAYENGTRFMSIKTLKKLCDGYNLSFESLSRLWVQAALEAHA
jgi:transcriptional regulator with XRE-family HTH domain